MKIMITATSVASDAIQSMFYLANSVLFDENTRYTYKVISGDHRPLQQTGTATTVRKIAGVLF